MGAMMLCANADITDSTALAAMMPNETTNEISMTPMVVGKPIKR